MKIKAVIIDDDYFMSEVLKDLLTENHPAIEVVGIANNGFSGLKVIEQTQPDLIFLDVEMPDMNGFEMLSMLKEIPFQIIFTTAFSQYAIKRYQASHAQNANSKRVELALFNLKQATAANQILPLQLQDGEIRLRLSQIVSIEGERNYSILRLTDQSKKLSAKNLAYFEEILGDKGFFRSHKSYLVNVLHIDQTQGGHFLLKDHQTQIPISRRRKKEAKEWFFNHSSD